MSAAAEHLRAETLIERITKAIRGAIVDERDVMREAECGDLDLVEATLRSLGYEQRTINGTGVRRWHRESYPFTIPPGPEYVARDAEVINLVPPGPVARDVKRKLLVALHGRGRTAGRYTVMWDVHGVFAWLEVSAVGTTAQGEPAAVLTICRPNDRAKPTTIALAKLDDFIAALATEVRCLHRDFDKPATQPR